MRGKKILSLITAVAMSLSAFAGFAVSVNAEVGDALISQNFDTDENAWGAATAGFDVEATSGKAGYQYVAAADLTGAPAAVTGNVFNYMTTKGHGAVSGSVTLDGSTGAAKAYNVSFDAYLKNGAREAYGDPQGANPGSLDNNGGPSTDADFYYNVRLGDGTNAVLDFVVKGSELYYVSNETEVKVDVDLGENGAWVNVNLNCDTATKTVRGTITPDGGEAAAISGSFAKSAASVISNLSYQTYRVSGNTKAYVNNYIDNFVITEASPLANHTVTINMVCDGTTLATKTESVLDGTAFTVGDGYKKTIDAGEKYYTYVSSDFTDGTAINEDTTVRLTFEEHTKENYVSVVYDFEDDGASISPDSATLADTTASVVTSTVGTTVNDTKVLSLAMTSTKEDKPSRAYFDLSAQTARKANALIEYDVYITDSGDGGGRVRYIVQNGTPTGNKASEASSGFLSIGKTGGTAFSNCKANAWNHVTVSIDLTTGKSEYTVTADGATVAQGKVETEDHALTNLNVISWNPITTYLDNLKVSAWGTYIANPPEEASQIEGSYLNLVPSSAEKTFATFANLAEGAAGGEEVLNHSNATAIANDTTISTYDSERDNVRGKSIYAVYDVLVNIGDKLVLKAVGSESSKLGTSFGIEGKGDGLVDLYALVDKGDKTTIANDLVCGTWYRVLIEIPQVNNNGATNTGNATYTIYRINTANPAKVSEVAVTKAELTPRNLSDRGAVNIITEVTGKPYVDNGATFQAAGGYKFEPAAQPEEPATGTGSGLNLLPDGATKIADFANEGEEEILNHAGATIPGEVAGVTALPEDGNNRGKSVYALYDVYVDEGDKLTVQTINGDIDNESASLGAQFVIEGTDSGKAAISTITSSSGANAIKSKTVNGTWYRVLLEVPQGGTAGAETTGDATYTIYRIDKTDCSKVTETIVKASGISPRAISGKTLTNFRFNVEGNPAIDNGVIFSAASGFDLNRVDCTYADGKITLTANAGANPASALVVIAKYNSQLAFTGAELKTATFTNGTAEVTATLSGGDKVMVWDGTENMLPLADVNQVVSAWAE